MNFSRVFIEAGSPGLVPVAQGFASELRNFPYFQVVDTAALADTIVVFLDKSSMVNPEAVARYQRGGCRLIAFVSQDSGLTRASFSVEKSEPLDFVPYPGPSRLMEMFFEWFESASGVPQLASAAAPNPAFQAPSDLGPDRLPGD